MLQKLQIVFTYKQKMGGQANINIQVYKTNCINRLFILDVVALPC